MYKLHLFSFSSLFLKIYMLKYPGSETVETGQIIKEINLIWTSVY